MLGLMKNFYKYSQSRLRRDITIVVIGLDNAGKSTLLSTIGGKLDAIIVPTVGQSRPTVIKRAGNTVQFIDLGGGHTFRDVWQEYYESVHGVIFVIDSSDTSRLKECKKVLIQATEKSTLAGKPILILANKQDLQSALSEVDIAQHMGLDEGVLSGTRHSVKPCIALARNNNNVADKRVNEGVTWLLKSIQTEFTQLNNRVTRDVAEKEMAQKAKKEEVLKRVELAKEERRKAKEAAERGETTEAKPGAGAPPPPSDVPLCARCEEVGGGVKSAAVKKSGAYGWRAVCQHCADVVEGRKTEVEGEEAAGCAAAAAATAGDTGPSASSGPTAEEAAAPKDDPDVIKCVQCKTEAATRKCGVVGWQPVCDGCGDELEAARVKEEAAANELMLKRLEEEKGGAGGGEGGGGGGGEGVGAESKGGTPTPLEVAEAQQLGEPGAGAGASEEISKDFHVPRGSSASPEGEEDDAEEDKAPPKSQQQQQLQQQHQDRAEGSGGEGAGGGGRKPSGHEKKKKFKKKKKVVKSSGMSGRKEDESGEEGEGGEVSPPKKRKPKKRYSIRNNKVGVVEGGGARSTSAEVVEDEERGAHGGEGGSGGNNQPTPRQILVSGAGEDTAGGGE